jgi:hypothetical protein
LADDAAVAELRRWALALMGAVDQSGNLALLAARQPEEQCVRRKQGPHQRWMTMCEIPDTRRVTIETINPCLGLKEGCQVKHE